MTTTTLPRRTSAVSGGEFSQVVAPSSAGSIPSTGRVPDRTVGWTPARSGNRCSIAVVPAYQFDTMVALDYGRERGDPDVTAFLSALRGFGMRQLLRPGTSEAIDVPALARRFGLVR